MLGKPVGGLPKARQGLAKAKRALANPRPPYAGTAGPPVASTSQARVNGVRRTWLPLSRAWLLAANGVRVPFHERSRVLVERQLLAGRAKAAAWE